MKKSEFLRVNKIKPIEPLSFRVREEKEESVVREPRKEPTELDFHAIFQEETRKLDEQEAMKNAFIDSARKELDKKEKKQQQEDELEQMLQQEEEREMLERMEALSSYRRMRR